MEISSSEKYVEGYVRTTAGGSSQEISGGHGQIEELPVLRVDVAGVAGQKTGACCTLAVESTACSGVICCCFFCLAVLAWTPGHLHQLLVSATCSFLGHFTVLTLLCRA